MNFSQLYTITSYSLLSSTIRLEEFIQQAKKLGYTTLGITDKNVMYGAIEFYERCKKADIKPIIGLLLEYTPCETDQVAEILLFAKNFSGYQQLLKISSEKMINEESFYLEETSVDLKNIFAVILPDESDQSSKETRQEASLRYQRLVQLFDENSVYIGASFTCNPQKNPLLFSFYSELNIPLIALQEVRYLNREDDFSLKVLESIQSGEQLSLDQSLTELEGPYYLRRASIVQEQLSQLITTEATENTEKVAGNCWIELPLQQKLLPHFPISGIQTAEQYLRELCFNQLSQRVPEVTVIYEQRLDKELQIIHKMGFDDYFLIVWDVMLYVHKNNIVVGAGRGSAAGSLVAYVLSITDVDPIKYDLLFERFLNPERYSMPDIDIDLPDNRREEVLQYVKNKYGQYHVAQIATFGTMAAKMVLRDVARVFGLSQSESNNWSKAVPNVLKIKLETAFKESKQLADKVSSSDKNQLLFDTAKRLEGLPRHVSTHAAGVVISDQPLTEFVPLQQGSNGIFLTQFTMDDVEKIGLLKMDFLGLRNLSVLADSIKNIKSIYKQNVQLSQIPLEDEATLDLFRKGETIGIFQFESSGIRNVLRKLSPATIEDIAAVNALYRPGPMQYIDLFIRRKKGIESIEYVDPILEPILRNTYGVIVYQEQIIQVASQMAGFSLGQSDVLRRAVSKKKQAMLNQEREHFIAGAVKQGHSEANAKEVYAYIERFANYGFNRSHAFAYSFIGFQMAYFKVHYPGAFYVSILNSVRHNTAKVREYLSEARKSKLNIKCPSINESHYNFHLTKEKELLFGFSSLKGIRKEFVAHILSERKLNGFYQSFHQFLLRIDRKWLQLDIIQPLIAIGAFDELQSNRKQLMLSLESEIQNIIYSGGSLNLLEDTLKLKEIEVVDYSLEEKLEQEEHYLGVYLSGHPTEEFKKIRKIKHIHLVNEVLENQSFQLLVYSKDIRVIRTKKGEQMAFMEGDDITGTLSFTVFPTVFRTLRQTLDKNKVYYVEGKIKKSSYNQDMQMIVDYMQDARELETQISDITCYLKIDIHKNETDVLLQLKEIMSKNKGKIPIIIYFEKNGKKIRLTQEYWINNHAETKQKLQTVLGNENVIFN